jgi:serine/threonine-protein phosphatase 2A regulatory subunit B
MGEPVQSMKEIPFLQLRLKRTFSNAHAYHINSISPNWLEVFANCLLTQSDDETFLSADDLRINLWNLEISDHSFNIVDMKPPVMEDLNEVSFVRLSLLKVITSSQCHPTNCNVFVYSSSKGNVRLADMRKAALCDSHAKCSLRCFSSTHLQFLRCLLILLTNHHSSPKSSPPFPTLSSLTMDDTSSPETS